MCQGCADAIMRHFPETPKEHWTELLWSGTAFPFGGPEQVEKNLAQAKAAGCKNWKEAIAFATGETEKAMANQSNEID